MQFLWWSADGKMLPLFCVTYRIIFEDESINCINSFFFFLFLNLLHALSFLYSPSVRRQTVRWSLSLQSLETSPNYLVLNIGLSHLSTSPFIVLSQCPPPVQYLYLSFHFLWTCSRHWLSLLQPLIAELHLWCSGVCLSSVSLEPQLILNWPNEWVSSQACGW